MDFILNYSEIIDFKLNSKGNLYLFLLPKELRQEITSYLREMSVQCIYLGFLNLLWSFIPNKQSSISYLRIRELNDHIALSLHYSPSSGFRLYRSKQYPQQYVVEGKLPSTNIDNIKSLGLCVQSYIIKYALKEDMLSLIENLNVICNTYNFGYHLLPSTRYAEICWVKNE
jgi:hypothetical protein